MTAAPSVLVYCDQATDGGGWMLSYSYKHLSGHDDPVNGSKIPLDPVNGYSHIHLNQLSGYSSSAIESVRFYCQTSGHDRIMHFKHSHPVVSEIAYYGDSNANAPSVWRDTTCYVTKFPDHSAWLPESTANVYDHRSGHDGFRSFPFWNWGISHWAIASPGGTGINRYECDDIRGNSLPGAQSTNTTHNIWVKMKEKCCAYGYGNYSGRVSTPSLGSSYDLSIQFDESGVRLEYTNLGCGYSTPIPVNVSAVGRFEYLEVLQYGTAKCSNLGWIVVSAAYDNVWMFEYTYPSSGKVDTASITFDCNRSCSLA